MTGPGPVEAHIEHAAGFAAVVGTAPEGLAVDLGTGGGLPGLVLAGLWPASRWWLVDRRRRSVAFVAGAVAEMGWSERVAVVEARAEDAGRDPARRERAALVVARGFGPPAVVAECAAPLLEPGGLLVVSEPPASAGQRWDAEALADLGLGMRGVERRVGYGYAVLTKVNGCPDRFPRRDPAKRPLW